MSRWHEIHKHDGKGAGWPCLLPLPANRQCNSTNVAVVIDDINTLGEVALCFVDACLQHSNAGAQRKDRHLEIRRA